MRTAIDERLTEEARRFSLRLHCEHCVHFESRARLCSGGYPNEPHRTVELVPGQTLEFCKQFELF